LVWNRLHFGGWGKKAAREVLVRWLMESRWGGSRKWGKGPKRLEGALWQEADVLVSRYTRSKHARLQHDLLNRKKWVYVRGRFIKWGGATSKLHKTPTEGPTEQS